MDIDEELSKATSFGAFRIFAGTEALATVI
jgi:hypothetical protein